MSQTWNRHRSSGACFLASYSFVVRYVTGAVTLCRFTLIFALFHLINQIIHA